jgi:uncharacterized protein Yka (UPF0111/DUF47 family)
MPERLEDLADEMEEAAENMRRRPQTIPFKRYAKAISDDVKDIARRIDEIVEE